MIISNLKNYKIVVDSKQFGNMHGISLAEVAKKAASKILRLSSNKISRFSMIEVKTGKIWDYKAFKENLVRPYRKNGKLVKYRIIVKKMGKQVGGKYPPDLQNPDDSIFTFFPKEEYYFDYGPVINDIQSIEIFSDDDLSYQSFCIRFYVIGNVLYLSELNKCHYSGKINLNKIIEYAKSFDYLHFIKLTDASNIRLIDIDALQFRYISLSLLSILSSGNSWYNKYGFFSENYANELVENKKKIIMNINEFMTECIKNSSQNRSKLDEQKAKFFTYYNQEKTVQEIFTEIKEQLTKFGKNNNNSNESDKLFKEQFKEQFKIIFGILSIIEKSKIIIYDSNLTRILEK